jgi:hypothetical protein
MSQSNSNADATPDYREADPLETMRDRQSFSDLLREADVRVAQKKAAKQNGKGPDVSEKRKWPLW